MVEGHGWHARVGAGCFSPRWRWRECECQPVYRGPSTITYNGVSGKACIQRYAATRMCAHYCWCKSGQCIWLLAVMTVSALYCSSVSIGLPSPVDVFSGIFCPSTTPPSHIGLALLLLSFLLVPFIHALPLLILLHALWSRHSLILCSHLFMFLASPSLVITIYLGLLFSC